MQAPPAPDHEPLPGLTLAQQLARAADEQRQLGEDLARRNERIARLNERHAQLNAALAARAVVEAERRRAPRPWWNDEDVLKFVFMFVCRLLWRRVMSLLSVRVEVDFVVALVELGLWVRHWFD